MYKQARVLQLEGGVPPPPKYQPKDATGPDDATQEPTATQAGLAARRRAPTTSAGAGTVARYKQLALSPAPRQGREVPGGADRNERGALGHTLSQAGLTA